MQPAPGAPPLAGAGTRARRRAGRMSGRTHVGGGGARGRRPGRPVPHGILAPELPERAEGPHDAVPEAASQAFVSDGMPVPEGRRAARCCVPAAAQTGRPSQHRSCIMPLYAVMRAIRAAEPRRSYWGSDDAQHCMAGKRAPAVRGNPLGGHGSGSGGDGAASLPSPFSALPLGMIFAFRPVGRMPRPNRSGAAQEPSATSRPKVPDSRRGGVVGAERRAPRKSAGPDPPCGAAAVREARRPGGQGPCTAGGRPRKSCRGASSFHASGGAGARGRRRKAGQAGPADAVCGGGGI